MLIKEGKIHFGGTVYSSSEEFRKALLPDFNSEPVVMTVEEYLAHHLDCFEELMDECLNIEGPYEDLYDCQYHLEYVIRYMTKKINIDHCE